MHMKNWKKNRCWPGCMMRTGGHPGMVVDMWRKIPDIGCVFSFFPRKRSRKGYRRREGVIFLQRLSSEVRNGPCWSVMPYVWMKMEPWMIIRYWKKEKSVRMDMIPGMHIWKFPEIMSGLIIRPMSTHSIRKQFPVFWRWPMKNMQKNWGMILEKIFLPFLRMNRSLHIKQDWSMHMTGKYSFYRIRMILKKLTRRHTEKRF